MKRFDLLVEGEPRSLEFDGASVRSGRSEAAADVAGLGSGGYSIVLDGIQHAVHVAPQGGGKFVVTVEGARLEIEVLDPRRLSRGEEGVAGTGSCEVRAPMPGKVLAVHVAEGDRVRRGQGLLVIEAMKMQNELRSPRDGSVSAVRAAAGDAVAAGDALAVID